MTAANPAGGDYDDYASQYAANVAWRELAGPDKDPFGLLLPMFELLGDVTGHRVLDAGCGEGYLARTLAARGARVTGIDLSPRLIDQARAKDPHGLADIPALAGSHGPDAYLPPGARFPQFMLLAFSKPDG